MKYQKPKIKNSDFDQKVLKEIAKEKLAELKEPKGELEELSYKLLARIDKYSEIWFDCMLYLYDLEERRATFKKEKIRWKRLIRKPKFKEELDVEAARAYPIQDLVGEWRQFGNKIKTKCVFHDEKNPSFVIYLDDMHYYCFSCNKNGNAIDLLMERDGLTFQEAVKALT